ncbi:hypothetical protein AOQ88_01480 [Candidatus Riesia sp. GBBU]|nr:hypothetical protein AOQ88_01480 [Candidatus Riesia sp. GBBU]
MKKTKDKIQKEKLDIHSAINFLKKSKNFNFLESVDVSIKLNINKKKLKKNIYEFAYLPNGTGRKTNIVVFCNKKYIKDVINLGVKYAGGEDILEKVKKNKRNIDIILSSKETVKIAKKTKKYLGSKIEILNKELGTITENFKKSIEDINSGKIYYKYDDYGIIHASIGNINFSDNEIAENLESFLKSVKKSHFYSQKVDFFKSVYLSTTMGKSVRIDFYKLI